MPVPTVTQACPCPCCSRGVDLVRVEFVQDDVEDIKATVQQLRQRVGPDGFVFSSGGIGPTHDDVTYEAIAAAFGERLLPVSCTYLCC